MENRKVKQFMSGGWYQQKGEGYKERVKEAECMKILCMYENGKMRHIEIIPGIGGGRNKEE
jgi:hypothetical protein